MPRLLAPRYWGLHLLAVAAVGAAVLLGGWQYAAWEDQRAAEARDLTTTEPVALAETIGPDEPFPGDQVGRPVHVAGTWVPDGTVLVSGREHAGRDGYWVVTPLAVGGPDGSALPIVRGWTADEGDVPPPPTGAADLVAWLQPPEGTGQTDDDPRDDVLPQLRTADLVQRVDQDLYGAYAVESGRPGATNAGTEGLEPATLEQLPEVGRFTAVRNLLYAVEWWFFGAFAFFIWWRWLRDEQAGEQAIEEGGEEDGETQATSEPGQEGQPAGTVRSGQ